MRARSLTLVGPSMLARVRSSRRSSKESLLWGERVLRSVANLTRADGEEFLAKAPEVPVETEVTVFPLDEANQALDRLRSGAISARRCWLLVVERLRKPNRVGDPHDHDPREEPHQQSGRERPHQNRFPNWSIATIVDVVPSSRIANTMTPSL
jgi:hypothetical protein